jgi:hypothetical protein
MLSFVPALAAGTPPGSLNAPLATCFIESGAGPGPRAPTRFPCAAFRWEPKKKWGPALLPGPTAPSEGSAGVRDLIIRPEGPTTRPRSWRTSSGVAFHHGGPKTRFVVRFSSRKSLAPQFPSAGPKASATLMFHGPSWTGSLSRGLSPWGGNRLRKSEHQHFRRLLPTGPEIRSLRHRPERQFSLKPHSIACRRRSVLPSLPHLLAVSGLPVRRGLPSRSRIEPAQRFRVAQREK